MICSTWPETSLYAWRAAGITTAPSSRATQTSRPQARAWGSKRTIGQLRFAVAVAMMRLMAGLAVMTQSTETPSGEEHFTTRCNGYFRRDECECVTCKYCETRSPVFTAAPCCQTRLSETEEQYRAEFEAQRIIGMDDIHSRRAAIKRYGKAHGDEEMHRLEMAIQAKWKRFRQT